LESGFGGAQVVLEAWRGSGCSWRVTQLSERFKALRGTLRDLLGLECLVYIILIERVELGYLVDWGLKGVGKG